MAHKTDFKDALFEQRKYRMQNNPDGTVTPFDETEYTQVGDRVGAKEFNEIGAALNSLEGKMGERNLQTYTALSQLSLEAPVTMAQVFEAMPNNSYAVIDANGSNTITDVPVSGSGIVEISKINGGRNFARFTKSLSSQTVGMTMWYGTFSWADTTVFSGWKRLLEEDDVLETMEEIEANTDAGKAAGALAVKELSSDFQWKYLGTYTGKQDINIPASASCLLLQGYHEVTAKSGIQNELDWDKVDSDLTLYSVGNAVVTAIYTVNKPENKITLRNYYVLASWDKPSWADYTDIYIQKILYR